MTKDEHIEVLMTSLHLMKKKIEKLEQEVFDARKAKESVSHFIKLLLEASVPVPRTTAAIEECLKQIVVRNNGVTEDDNGFIVNLTDYNRVFIERW